MKNKLQLACCMVLLSLFCFSLTATADSTWRRESEQDDAGTRSRNCGPTLDTMETCYHTYTAADTDSDTIYIEAGATLCLDPDITTAGTATATIRLRRLLEHKDTAVTANNTTIILNQILDGNFTASTQTACIYEIPPGHYYVESVTAPGGQDVVVSLISHQQ